MEEGTIDNVFHAFETILFVKNFIGISVILKDVKILKLNVHFQS